MGYTTIYPQVKAHKHTDAVNDGGQLDLTESLFTNQPLLIWLLIFGD